MPFLQEQFDRFFATSKLDERARILSRWLFFSGACAVVFKNPPNEAELKRELREFQAWVRSVADAGKRRH